MKKIKRIVVKVVYEDDLSNDYNFLIVNKKITDRDQFREFKKDKKMILIHKQFLPMVLLIVYAVWFLITSIIIDLFSIDFNRYLAPFLVVLVIELLRLIIKALFNRKTE